MVVLAPFQGRLSIEAPASTGVDGIEKIQRFQVKGRCRSPILSAWRSPRPDEKLRFWAVTNGTDTPGYAAANGLGSRCAPAARRRLGLGALGIVVGAVILTFLGRRDNDGGDVVRFRGHPAKPAAS